MKSGALRPAAGTARRHSFARPHLLPFEWLGLMASALATGVFFGDGRALDKLVGQPQYHWHVLWMVSGIYLRFVPWALMVGAGAVLAWRWLRPQGWRRPLSEYLFVVRVFVAYCILLIVFRVVNFYVPVLHPGIDDALLQRADATLLGGRQAGEWLAPLIHPWLTHVMTGAYVSWFWLLFATLVLLLTAHRAAVSEYVFASLLAFYIGYLCYVVVPVIGPGYTYPFSVPVGDIAPHFTWDRLTIARDCFPSLHTALSVLMAVYIWRYRRWLAVVYIPLAAIIVFATLYLRFHYLCDDLAGAALGAACAWIAPRLHRRLAPTGD
ncbi:hypothetical protein GCM10025857_29140 [Alicyclobacillus contaminans]|uniref:phosphatase PAP2 family protein n=1 Tax=Alicyclobacillus contaminans TaxID=392016 RepID=UPI000424DA63|nr:phosphatase PAP2 family protein [Alicyclobacillus contaminans]GMA51557.1 hypothetical protein GCM10025857_29140 [Alicyclobacillus contaminans]